MFVFAYGSLMDPDSLARTLPEVSVADCVPAVCRGRVRTFGVAFPNDGSQPDKAYVDADGRRPEVVLMCELSGVPDAWVNGVCVPVGTRELAALEHRERRYLLTDLTGFVAPYAGAGVITGPVLAFVGRAEFTSARAVARGFVSMGYLRTVQAGAAYWDRAVPGFENDFVATTRMPSARQLRPLTRVDA